MQDFHTLVVRQCFFRWKSGFHERAFSEIEVLHLDQNYGFSAAVNAGIRHAQTPYVILLNNDTTVDPHFTEALLHAIRRSPDIFSVSSKMIQMYHPDLIDSAGDLYTLVGWGICRGTGLVNFQLYGNRRDLYRLCRSRNLSKSAFRRIGYFDESHFAYLEDIDIGYRARISASKICNLSGRSRLSCRKRDKAVPSITALK